MHTKPFKTSQGELFSLPAKLPELPPEARQKMIRLFARMMNEHLQKHPLSGSSRQREVGDE